MSKIFPLENSIKDIDFHFFLSISNSSETAFGLGVVLFSSYRHSMFLAFKYLVAQIFFTLHIRTNKELYSNATKEEHEVIFASMQKLLETESKIVDRVCRGDGNA